MKLVNHTIEVYLTRRSQHYMLSLANCWIILATNLNKDESLHVSIGTCLEFLRWHHFPITLVTPRSLINQLIFYHSTINKSNWSINWLMIAQRTDKSYDQLFDYSVKRLISHNTNQSIKQWISQSIARSFINQPKINQSFRIVFS